MDASHSHCFDQYRALRSFHPLFFSSLSVITHALLFSDCIGQDKSMYSKRYGFIDPLFI